MQILPPRDERFMMGVLGACCFLVICLFFAGLLGSMLWQGFGVLSLDYFTAEPTSSGRGGGIGPILQSTFLIMGVCLAATLPLGIGTAAFLFEASGKYLKLSRWVRLSLEMLAGVPSIVFGLFGNYFFCKVLGMGFSILSGGLTLACMALPIFIRTVEEGFRLVPVDYRKAAMALGFSQPRTFLSVILPISAPALVVGVVLGVGRALAETAALIFTSGYVDRFPESLLDSGRALSVHIFDLSMNVSGGDKMAYASSLVLVGILILINSLAKLISRYWLARNMRLV